MNFSSMQAPKSNPQPDPETGHFGRMTRLHRARWHLAVLEELALPGRMGLAPVFDGAGEVIDFTWWEASPTSTLAFGCAGEDLVGHRLKQVLTECEMDASVFGSYQTVFFQKRAQVLHIHGKHGVTVHSVSPLPAGLGVEVTQVAAMQRVLTAQRAMREVE